MDFKTANKLILSEVAAVSEAIDTDSVQSLMEKLENANQVFLVGVGRVMLSLQAFDKRLNHLGIKAYCVGDLNEPAITKEDLLIVGSGSGETVFPVEIAKIAKKHGALVAHIGSNADGSMKEACDLFVRIPCKTKLNRPGEFASEQLMSSLFEQALYIFCDSLCLMIAQKNKIDISGLWRCHANLE